MADVIIVGAGPAGSIAAKRLSDFGFSVSLYEKEKLPRHKHCAGYISCKAIRALDSIGVNCRDILRQRVRGWTFQSGDEILGLELEGSEDNLPGNVYREEFDYFLTQLAAQSGTRVIDSTKVIKILIPEDKEEKCSVITQKGREECEIILGADGVRSIVRKYLGIPYPKTKWAVAMEAEVPVDERAIDSYSEKNFMSFNYVQVGYAWVFPKRKGKTVNVGLGVLAEEAKRMKKGLLDVWKTLLQNQEWYTNQSVSRHVEMMPYIGTVDRLGCERVLLLGDAAGLVDPVGGEGVPYAIKSGIDAAEATRLQLEGKAPLLHAYDDLMEDMLDEINVYAMKLHNYFFVKNRIKTVLRLTKKNEDLRNLILEMSRGLISYEQTVGKFSLIKWILAYLRSVF